jgi:outer membrane protein
MARRRAGTIETHDPRASLGILDPRTMRHILRNASILLLAFFASPGVRAQTNCGEPSEDCVEVGQWDISLSLGGGVRTNPIRSNSNIPLVAIPKISYYGKRFFLENLEAGVTLHETDSNTFNLVAAPGYDRVFFVSNDLQNIFVDNTVPSGFYAGTTFVDTKEGRVPIPGDVPLRPRRTTYLTGPEWSFSSGPLTGQLSALYEVTGRHHGTEVRAAMAAPVIKRKGEWVVSGGVTWKSAEIVRYYYGVEGVYQPKAALNPFIKVSYDRPLSNRWALNAFVHYEHLANAVADSPIVSESEVTTAFVGFVYKVL